MQMRRMMSIGLVLLLTSAPAWAVDGKEPAGTKKVVTGGAVISPSTSPAAYRGSTIAGMPVRNAAGDDLGKIEDLVIDLNTGEVRYAALSFGGFLGFGDKLFAVPMHSLRLVSGEKDRHFVVNLDKARLEKAPGFNKDVWPDFANPNWSEDVDKFYEADSHGIRHDGIVVSTKEGKLTMSDKDGSDQHSHAIGERAKIVLDGKPAALTDLKSGFAVTVTMSDHKGEMVVQAIDARSRRIER